MEYTHANFQVDCNSGSRDIEGGHFVPPPPYKTILCKPMPVVVLVSNMCEQNFEKGQTPNNCDFINHLKSS